MDFSQRDVKRADFVTELLEKYLEPYLAYLEQVLLFRLHINISQKKNQKTTTRIWNRHLE